MTCFFIGHSITPPSVIPALNEAVERHIVEYEVTDFVVGRYGRFDEMAADAVRDARERHPGVTLTLLTPYYPFTPVSIPEEFDRTFYPPGMEFVPKPFAIVRANQYMVRESEYLICFSMGGGNAGRLVDMALRREKKGLIRVENLAYS